MAVNVSNIVVGEATIQVGDNADATDISAMDAFDDIGATQNGVEISWEPDIVDIEIDQFGDAAKLIQTRVKVMVKTTLAEATLSNLALAWNYDSVGTDDIVANNDGANTSTFLFGTQSVTPYEKALVITGKAPGTTASTTKERKFYTKRAISMAATQLNMKRDEASTFAVEFRILPTIADTGYEYGKVIDDA
jgi:hypothetical protein